MASLEIKDFLKQKEMTSNLQTAGTHRLSLVPVSHFPPEVIDALREVFLASGFAASSKRHSADESLVLGTLKRLFIYGEAVPTDEATSAFSPLNLIELIHGGLLYQENDQVQSLLQVQIYQGLIFFSDFIRNEPASDFVLPVGPAGKYLAYLTIRRPVHTVLDLGCGCGIQSILAAQHCSRVIATDINPRALALTRLNADLNEVTNIEILEGSFFEPVKGRTFDLIIANLPYVITPQNGLIYRDTIQPGDAGLRQLIREIPTFLAEGGTAELLANWVHERVEPWWQPLRTSLAGLEVDAWLIYNGSKDPEAYAGMWLKNEQESAKTKEDWLKWYNNQRIEQIALGAVILRRRSSGINWVCAAGVTRSLETPAGEQLSQLFAAQDYLADLANNEAFHDEVLTPVNVDIQFTEEGSAQAVSTSGLFFQASIQPHTAQVIRHLDGKSSLCDAIQNTGWKLGDAPDPDKALLDEIQTMLGLGMLAPVSIKGDITQFNR
jgi:SAM-dependent methyltransferase